MPPKAIILTTMERKMHRLTFFHPLIEKISVCFQNESYIVGGFVRDRIYRAISDYVDIDIVTADELKSVKGCVEERLSIKGFVFKREKEVVSFFGNNLRMDISELHGSSITEDLGERDFTINAIAVSLEDIVSPLLIEVKLIDPFNGIEDLERGILRPVSDSSIKKDPLRIVRGIRLKVKFDLRYSDLFLKQLRENLEFLKDIAVERIREELVKILKMEETDIAFRDMFDLSVFHKIFPEFKGFEEVPPSGLHQFDLVEHTLRTVKYIKDVVELKDEVLGEFGGLIGSLKFLPNMSDIEALKLAALYHDVAKPITMKRRKGKLTFYGHDVLGARIARESAIRLSFGKKVGDFMFTVIRNHLRPFFLFNEKRLSDRAKFRFFKDSGSYSLHVLLHSIADWMATSDVMKSNVNEFIEFVKGMVEFYKRMSSVVPLLSGDEIMEVKGWEKPTRCVGEIKEKLFELQVLGKITNKDDAVKFVRGYSCESAC